VARLRRAFLYERYFFLTAKLLPARQTLVEGDYTRLANALARMREKNRFLPTAWVFLPDHWHAIICPTCPLSLGREQRLRLSQGVHGKFKVWGRVESGSFAAAVQSAARSFRTAAPRCV